MKNLLSAVIGVLLATSLLFAAKPKTPKDPKKGPKKGSKMYGWREDIVFALETAEGKRDARGRVVGKGKKGKKGMIGPDQAIRELKLMLPQEQLNIKPNYDQVPEESLAKVKEAVEFAKKQWEKAIPDLKLQFVEDRNDADLVVNFMGEVLDPRDPNGIKTVCSHFRTLDEGAKGKGKGAKATKSPTDPHRMKTVAVIGFGHITDNIKHNQQGVAHLAAAAIGCALGLDDRKDESSVMHPNIDRVKSVLTPTREDVTILRTLEAALHFHIGKLQLNRGRSNLAKEEFEKIPPNTRYSRMAQDAMSGADPTTNEEDPQPKKKGKKL